MLSLYSAVDWRRVRFSRTVSGITYVTGNVDIGFGISMTRIGTLKSMLSQTAVVWDQVGTQGSHLDGLSPEAFEVASF